MSLLARTLHAFESVPMPNAARRGAIALLVARASQKLSALPPGAEQRFTADMANRPIAEHTEVANAQHYELPADFFRHCLGPRLKYSCCLYEAGTETLGEAEDRALLETCTHADLHNGQRILELGCGWGALSLWMAERYPQARITAVSNSASQRAHIEAMARQRDLGNLAVVTADMNAFTAEGKFDRIVSVEMFEHMSNWRALLARCRTWLSPEGRLFVHVFAHRHVPYRYDVSDRSNWIAQHFFTGGVMPSQNLIRNFSDHFEVEDEWWWDGRHYARTALDWARLFEARLRLIRPLLARTYGDGARLWEHRWRLFFFAVAEMFAHRNGTIWGVAHHRLKPVGAQ
jgi:cyclopropane-fatty-acyl-phospholipid synthase